MRLLLGVVACWALMGCSTLGQEIPPPKLSITSLQVGDVEGLSQSFEVGLNITNPSAMTLNIRGLSYSLAINGYELVQGVSSDVPQVPAYGESSAKLVAKTNLFNAVRFLNNYIQGNGSEELTYELKAQLDVGRLLGRVNVVETGKVSFKGIAP